MEEPEDADEAEKEAYATAVYEAFTRFFDAYLTSLENLTAEEDDEDMIQGNRDGADALIETLYENDFVAQVGPTLIFRDQAEFDKYFLDAFWRQGYYGAGLWNLADCETIVWSGGVLRVELLVAGYVLRDEGFCIIRLAS